LDDGERKGRVNDGNLSPYEIRQKNLGQKDEVSGRQSDHTAIIFLPLIRNETSAPQKENTNIR
jgi:hypothetical protein